MQRHMMKIIGLALLAALLASSLNAQEGKVYRWVDENGEVHYTQSLPPDFEDKGHDVLDDQGIVRDEDVTMTPEYEPDKKPDKEELQELPRDSSGLQRPKALYSEAETQRRMDSFLMLRYDSKQEITDAMNVEIKQLEYDRRLLQTSRESLNEAYLGMIRVAGNKQRAGMTVEESESNQIRGLQRRLRVNQTDLNSLMVREQNIRADFKKQLDRYQTLIEQNAEDSPG